MNKFEIAANIALFLTETKGSCLATFQGSLPASKQRSLFGCFLGKGQIIINGSEETIEHFVKVCFGLDYDVTFKSSFSFIKETCENQKIKFNF